MNDPIQLDWQAYWEAFKRLHGEPVQSGGRLLFPDGWAYVIDNYEGPEWPPPKDPVALRWLQRIYWRERRVIVQQERNQLLTQIDSLETMQFTRSAELHQTLYTTTVDDDGNEHQRAVSEPLNIEGLRRGRLAWLEADLQECDRKLQDLGL